MLAFFPMFYRPALGIALLVLHTATVPAEAATFFENIHIRSGGRNTRSNTIQRPVQLPRARASITPTGGTCLYRNAQGDCMIEQYYGSSTEYYPDRIRSWPLYDRDYLLDERRYSDRDDDDDEDDEFTYRYFDDDDSSYDDDSSFDDDDSSFDDDDSGSGNDDDSNDDDDDSGSDDDDDSGSDDDSDDDDSRSGDDEDDEDDSSDDDDDNSSANDDEDDNDS